MIVTLTQHPWNVTFMCRGGSWRWRIAHQERPLNAASVAYAAFLTRNGDAVHQRAPHVVEGTVPVEYRGIWNEETARSQAALVLDRLRQRA